MLPQHNLIKINGEFVIIKQTGPFKPSNSMVSFSHLNTSFCTSESWNTMSSKPCDELRFCIPGFNAGCVPLRCSLEVLGHERRVITGNLLIGEKDLTFYELPPIQKIQLAISESIIGEEFREITIVNSTFWVLYPFQIDKPLLKVEVKEYANCEFRTGESRALITDAKRTGYYLEPTPTIERIQRPNQVWDISQNRWIIVPKPRPRDRAWSWNEDTLSWDCPKNQETGELQENDRTGKPNCWPPNREIRVATYHSTRKD